MDANPLHLDQENEFLMKLIRFHSKYVITNPRLAFIDYVNSV